MMILSAQVVRDSLTFARVESFFAVLDEVQARGPVSQFMFDFISSMSGSIRPTQIRVRVRQGIAEIGTNKSCFQAE